jgi:hypothetical protein
MSGLQEVGGHPASHVSQSDESDVHSNLSFTVKNYSTGGSFGSVLRRSRPRLVGSAPHPPFDGLLWASVDRDDARRRGAGEPTDSGEFKGRPQSTSCCIYSVGNFALRATCCVLLDIAK